VEKDFKDKSEGNEVLENDPSQIVVKSFIVLNEEFLVFST